MPLVKPRPSRSPYPYMIAGAVFLVVAIFAIANWQEARRKYEYRGGPIGDLSRIHEPYYKPERQVAAKPKPVYGASKNSDWFSDEEIQELINSPTARELYRPVLFNDCLSMIRHVSITVATPKPLIETEDVSVVEWPLSTGGYFIMSCSRATNELIFAKSIKAGDWLLLPR